MTPLMSNDHVRLRALEPTDLDLLYGWENDASLWAATDTVAPYARHTLWQYLQDYTGDIYKTRQLRLIAEQLDSTAIGTVDFFNFDPLNNRAELGLFAPALCLHPHRQRGLPASVPRLRLCPGWCVASLGQARPSLLRCRFAATDFLSLYNFLKK